MQKNPLEINCNLQLLEVIPEKINFFLARVLLMIEGESICVNFPISVNNVL